MKNLYTFNKTSNHVKLFKWLWGVDPTETFKTMCPYFWSYVATILIIPIPLIAKVFGKYGKQFNYNKNRRNKNIVAFKKRAAEITEPKKAFLFKRSKCWDKWGWRIDSEIDERLSELYREHRRFLEDKKYEESKKKEKSKEKREETIANAKESKIIQFIAIAIIVSVIISVLYIFYFLISFAVSSIDWPLVAKWTGRIVLGAIAALVLFLTGKYTLPPLWNRIKCIILPECKLCKIPLLKYCGIVLNYIGAFFLAIIKGFAIFGDMVYATYKKHCPIITWEE